MPYTKKYKTIFLIPLFLMLLIPNDAYAEFPKKPITLIVPFKAGGMTDTFARILAGPLGQSLNTKLTVVNRVGTNRWSYIAAQEPDGYTLTFIPDPYIKFITKYINSEIKIEQFQVINIFAQAEYVVVTSARGAYTKLGDINNSSKSISLSYPFGADYYAANALKTKLKSKVELIQSKPPDAFKRELLNGYFDIGVMILGDAINEIKNGQLKAIGLLSDKKSEFLHDVPTAKEVGIDAMACFTHGLYTNVNTPKEAIDILRKAAADATQGDRFVKFLRGRYLTKVNYTKKCEDDTYPCDTGDCCKD